MGRYIFFKQTDIEHKFLFAIQPSEDILKYGGYLCLRNPECESESDDMGHIRWRADEDVNYIYRQLQKFGLPMIDEKDLATYEKTTSGYYMYMSDIRRRTREALNIGTSYQPEDAEKVLWETYATYILGHSIYFQLHMVPELSAAYEQ